ncbi:3-hydroxybutyryl-CoA dehydratase [Halobiforma lacisalsi AJ5]|uniref:3-hydroxybutyryl-CoA dehydratase n=1 Tax=Natronobacterium lacisalsi AJ5 TaxID=358396 RepID=M0LEH7_NATLA|nr:enoyl-CoA hydratase-related protein [Halobiforma lacisalsi]APW96731.1 3-hydroxybutyryl-CoA dehydratase [Halobiforma lacisalsi AJ5]EMA31982.1 short chain enoyl-CoA hydratase [Halobiforma lacisalsi AJ5]
MSDRVDGAEAVEAAAADCGTVRATVGDRVAGVATVTMRRPDARNALNGQLREELKTVLEAVEDSDVRVVVLTGADDAKAFVAGADVGELRERDALEQREASKRPRVYEVVDDLRQPVIARLNGHALGGGCELATACDVRIAHERAKLGQPEITLGIMPGGGGTQRLPRLVGEGQAMRLILSGDLIGAEEAREIGLVDIVCDSDEALDEEVYGLAESMAANSPVALEFAKEAVKAGSRMDLESGIEYEAELFAQLFATEDKNEGIDAFFEDREPEWQGR